MAAIELGGRTRVGAAADLVLMTSHVNAPPAAARLALISMALRNLLAEATGSR